MILCCIDLSFPPLIVFIKKYQTCYHLNSPYCSLGIQIKNKGQTRSLGLPEWPVLPSIINMKEDLQLLAQVGAHQTLHVDEQVMGAGGRGRFLLTVAVLHLQGGKDRVLMTFDRFYMDRNTLSQPGDSKSRLLG